MELTEDEIIQKYGKNCCHCNRNTLLPYEYEWSCVSCGFNLIKRKHELSKKQRKKFFNNRMKYAEVKILSICVDVYKIYESDEYIRIYTVLSTLKSKKLNINNTIIEINENTLENPDFEQNTYSLTSSGVNKIAQDSKRIMKWICFYDRYYYENIKYCDLLGSVCK